MTCDERKDSILFYAAGVPEPAEEEALRDHLSSGCPQCSGVLAEAQAMLARLPLGLAMTAAPEGALQRLMDRVDQPTAATSRRASRGGIAGKIFFASALAAGVAAAISGGLVWRAMHEREQQLAEAIRFLDAERLQLVSLAAPEKGPASGNLFWDVSRHQWYLRVANLKPPGAGRTYQFWAIGGDGKPISAGLFDTDSGGKADIYIPIPAAVEGLKVVAITDEPAGGSPGPTGAKHLVGEVK